MIRAVPALGRGALAALLAAASFLAPGHGAAQTASRSVVAGCDRDFPPYEFVDQDGQPAGFDVDLLRAVAGATGLKLEVRPGVWSDVLGQLDRGEVDVLAGVSYSRERDERYDFSVPFLSMQIAVFWRDGTPPIRSLADLSHQDVAVQRAGRGHDFLARSGVPVTLYAVDGPPEALRLVASGTRRYALAPKLEGSYLVRQLRLGPLRSSDLPALAERYGFMVRDGEDELLGHLNEGLGIVKATGQFDAIYSRWLGALEPTPTTLARALWQVVWVLVPLLALLALAAAWSWMLKRRVDRHTAQLRGELAERRRVDQALRDSEARFRALAENAPLGILIYQQGVLVYANTAVTAISGFETDALLGSTPSELIHEDHTELVEALSGDHGAGRATALSRHEARVVTKSGEERWADCSVTQTSLGGEPATIVVFSDITVPRRAREIQSALYEISEAAHVAPDLEALFPRLHRVVGRLMPAQNFYIALYDRARDLVSFPYFVDERDETPAPMPPGRGLTSYILRTGKPLLATADAIEELERRGELESLGAPSAQWLGVPLRLHQEIIGALVVQSYSEAQSYAETELNLLTYVSSQAAQAIERKRAEQALRESQRTLTTLLDNLPGMAYRCRLDSAWTFEFISDGCLQLTGLSAAEIMADPEIQFTNEDDRQEVIRAVDAGVAEHRPWEATYRIGTASGAEKWVWERGQAVYNETGQAVAIEGFIADVSARKVVEEALRLSEERYRLALAATQDIIYDWDISTGHIFWSANVEHVLGLTQQEMGSTFDRWMALIHPDDRRRVEEQLSHAVDQGEFFSSEYRFARKGGEYAYLRDRGYIVRDARNVATRMVGAMADETARRQLESQLRQAQKMEAIGQLAGGIAHDFNNLLLAVLTSAELLDRRLAASDSSRREVSTIQRTARRATELTRSLLAFSRRQVLQPQKLDLNALIADTLPLLRRMIPEDVRIELHIGEGLGAIEADPGQITQILVNLCVNARDAMPGGGVITIATSRAVMDTGYAMIHPEALPGAYACLAVTDTGAGIAKEHIPHIFEPFFTTKEVGKGTGLGLSTVYGIVKQHQGFIYAYSEPGKGTTFKAYLPVVAGPGQAIAHDAGVAVGGSETILVVEDEDEVRVVLLEVLAGLGYTVLEAGDGVVALEVLRDPHNRVDLVLTDVVMPRMGGLELRQQARSAGLPVPFLFSSGYAEDMVRSGPNSDEPVHFIGKPYDIDTLARKVREALDATARPRSRSSDGETGAPTA